MKREENDWNNVSELHKREHSRCLYSRLSSVKLVFQASSLECVQTEKKEQHSSSAGDNKRHVQWDLVLGRDCSEHGNG